MCCITTLPHASISGVQRDPSPFSSCLQVEAHRANWDRQTPSPGDQHCPLESPVPPEWAALTLPGRGLMSGPP